MRRTGTSSWLPIKPSPNPIDLHHASANHPHASPASANLTEDAPQDPPPVLRLRRTDSSNWSVLEKVCKVEMFLLFSYYAWFREKLVRRVQEGDIWKLEESLEKMSLLHPLLHHLTLMEVFPWGFRVPSSLQSGSPEWRRGRPRRLPCPTSSWTNPPFLPSFGFALCVLSIHSA